MGSCKAFVWAHVLAPVWAPILAPVWASVWAPVCPPVLAPVWAHSRLFSTTAHRRREENATWRGDGYVDGRLLLQV